MSTAVATRPEQRLARPLKVLVPLIKNAIQGGHDAANAAAQPFYQTAGDLLMEAKSQIEHGKFEKWVKDTFEDREGRSEITAERAAAERKLLDE
jgi:hypothetical protein